jgi:hypothetical protein
LTNAVTYASVGKTKFVPDSLMYMPYPQIAGCRPYWETDNRDCRATVVIPISSLPTHEAVAEFYAHLAYPEPVDATQRQKYCIALSRWAVLERSNIDKTWEKKKPRAGDVFNGSPILLPRIESIDVSAIGDEMFGLNHNVFADNRSLIDDIGRLVLSGTRPPDQRSPQIRCVPEGNIPPDYWRYVP